MSIPNHVWSMRGAVLAMVCTLSHCGPSLRQPAGIPNGNGWHCFAPHPDGSHATSCHRARADCVRGVADAMEEARRQGEISGYSSCAMVPDAWCVSVSTDAAACMATRAECERLRVDSETPVGECIHVP